MADFDPDKYLEKKTGKAAGSFDPDAYLAAKSPAPAGGYDHDKANAAAAEQQKEFDDLDEKGRAFLHSATYGLSDEIGAGLSQIPVIGKYLNTPLSGPHAGEVPPDQTYRQAQQELEKEGNQAVSRNPGPAMLGSFAAPMPGGSISALGRVGNAAVKGFAGGALQGAGEAKPGETLVDAAKGGLVGGAVGGTLGYLGSLASKYGPEFADWLKEKAINAGRRVLTNGADSMSKRAPVAAEAVEEALRSKAITPFGNNASTLEKLNQLTEDVGDQYGGIVDKLEAGGVQGPEARSVAQSLAGKLRYEKKNNLNQAVKDVYASNLNTLQTDVAPGLEGNLGLRQAENLKRSLQKQAKYGLFQETPGNEARQDVASMMRQANEDAIARGTANASPELQTAANEFVPVKQRLGRLLEAESAATRGFTRAAQRSGISPTQKAAAAAEFMHTGSPLKAAKALGVTHLLQDRGGSTIAALGLRASDAIKTAGPYAPALEQALSTNGVKGMLALHQALKSRPDYDAQAVEAALSDDH
jgi:hypothetical protein